jgi:pSer/pThr/pTyr-binding forkhead associated (FHA) protein
MECDVALNDTFLSGEHARLELRGDEWTLEDLRSTNGTFLNGLEVRDPTTVNEGDVVRIGRVELKLMR